MCKIEASKPFWLGSGRVAFLSSCVSRDDTPHNRSEWKVHKKDVLLPHKDLFKLRQSYSDCSGTLSDHVFLSGVLNLPNYHNHKNMAVATVHLARSQVTTGSEVCQVGAGGRFGYAVDSSALEEKHVTLTPLAEGMTLKAQARAVRCSAACAHRLVHVHMRRI